MSIATKPVPMSAPVAAAGPGSPAVLAVVVTHNGRKWLKDCLVSLNAQTYPHLDVLVVDDASPDFRSSPHLKRVVKRHLRRRRWGFMRTPRSLGFGGAINWALSRVRTDADLLLFVHDDAALDSDALEQMAARLAKDRDTAIVGPKIVSWDDPAMLEEVGMAVDRFGYPYKGLEQEEMDLGQHDHPSEVFYVTSTCMLVDHDVFRRLRGWDAQMRAFSEDLDLCWRARIAGHAVRVEPSAKARHAIALATGERSSRYRPTRYFIRRNRLRAIIKNASAPRLFFLVPLFILLALTEMIGFIVLRQPGEILNVARALAWNLARFPQTLSARARAQRIRAVPDRRLRRLTVKETTRIRSYVGYQAERLEEAWGRRAEFVAARSSEARALGHRMRGAPAALAVIVVIGLLLGFRGFLWSPPAAVGELLPYPERASALWRAFASPWQSVGLGQPGPTSPSLLLLGVWPLVTFGAAAAAQKLLIFVLGLGAFAGAYRLVSEVVDRPGRWTAGSLYLLGAVGYSGMRQGALGALVLGAAAPYVLHSLLRLTGWVRPRGFNVGAEVGKLAIASALGASMAPGCLLVFAGAAVVLAAARALVARPAPAKELLATAAGMACGWALLLPWSATWLSPTGPLDRVWGSEWRSFAATFADHGTFSVLLGQTPDAPALFGMALPVLGLIAVLVAQGQRRRLALALWSVIVASGLLIDLIASGSIRPPVASPTEAGVLASVAFAGLGGIAVGAFRLDLKRRGLGLLQPVALGGLAAAAFLVVAGLGPAVLDGGWEPGGAGHEIGATTVEEVRTVLAGEVQQQGQFRALWVGTGWSSSSPSALRPHADHVLTGSRGQVLSDLFQAPAAAGERSLDRALNAIRSGSTDRGGRLLGAFNISFVVLERGPGVPRWLTQRDFGVVRDEAGYLLLENAAPLARSALYTRVPPEVAGLRAGGSSAAPRISAIERRTTVQDSASSRRAPDASGPGAVFLSEAFDPGWEARVGEQPLERLDGGWANAWEVPPSIAGTLVISYPRTAGGYGWLMALGVGWLVALGAAGSRGRPPDRPGSGATS